MEIMVKGGIHDHFAELLGLFVMAVAGQLGIRIKPQGEMTWMRPEIERGIEADKCYYLDPAKIAAALGEHQWAGERCRGFSQSRFGGRGRHFSPEGRPGRHLRGSARRGALDSSRRELDD